MTNPFVGKLFLYYTHLLSARVYAFTRSIL